MELPSANTLIPLPISPTPPTWVTVFPLIRPWAVEEPCDTTLITDVPRALAAGLFRILKFNWPFSFDTRSMAEPIPVWGSKLLLVML